MLISKTAIIKWNSKNKKWYESKDYIYTKMGDEFLVKVEDLTNGSNVYVDVECDGCNKELKDIIWNAYLKCVKNDGKYYCHNCAQKLFGNYNLRKTLFNKSQSFAQWGIDNLGNDFLKKYWDWEKNNELDINPWKIAKGNSRNKVWIKCQEKDYHDSYDVTCNNFVNNSRCPYCCNFHGKVHPLDSLGTLYSNVFQYWSDKNKKSPFNYTSNSHQEVYWKCPERKHKDFKRRIQSSTIYNFRCPECQHSKGEESISNDLINKCFIKISQEEFDQLIDKDKYNKNYFIPQMKYVGLLGIGNGLLSYDFYIPKLNLLIEYQGEFHDGTAKLQTKEEFEYQQEHDRRKKVYAQNNNINLLEIWYWDYDRIEEILDKELNIL